MALDEATVLFQIDGKNMTMCAYAHMEYVHLIHFVDPTSDTEALMRYATGLGAKECPGPV